MSSNLQPRCSGAAAPLHPGHWQNVDTCLPIPGVRTSAQNVCRWCSNGRVFPEASAIGHRCAGSTRQVRRTAGILLPDPHMPEDAAVKGVDLLPLIITQFSICHAIILPQMSTQLSTANPKGSSSSRTRRKRPPRLLPACNRHGRQHPNSYPSRPAKRRPTRRLSTPRTALPVPAPPCT
jgi:hypothetical protein